MFGGNFYNDDDHMVFRSGNGGGMGMGGPPSSSRRNRRFDEYFRCYPIAVLDRRELNYGGKIIMPPSALEKLTRLHIAYPMLFELRNGTKEATTHAGVLEFIAEEGRVYLPYWMMQRLQLEPGDLIQIKSTDLPSGRFVKLQPQSMQFITAISDPKAVLENVLRNFSALTRDDVFQFLYNDEVFEIAILEVKPENPHSAISCVETDLEVDFAPPLDYVEPIRQPTPAIVGPDRMGSVTPVITEGSMAKAIGYAGLTSAAAVPANAKFSGVGHKLKATRNTSAPGTPPRTSTPVPVSVSFLAPVSNNSNGSPRPLRLPPGQLFFGYPYNPVRKDGEDKDAAEAKPSMFFSGKGQTLRSGDRKSVV